MSKETKQLFFFCFFMLLMGFSAFSQTTKVDELLAQLDKNASDTAQIKVMRKLSVVYSSVDPTKKFYYANQYRILAEKHGIDSLVSSGYLDMGNSWALRSNLDSALHYFNVGHKIAKKSNFVSGIARGYINIGYVLDRLDRKKEAVTYYKEALQIYRKINLRRGINQCITNLGSIYMDLQEYKTADLYFQQVLDDVVENHGDEMALSNALHSMGGSKSRLGEYKKSLEFYKKSLAIKEKIGDLNGIALDNWGIGELFVDTRAYGKAKNYLEKALKINRDLKNLYQESAVLLTVAEAQLGLQDYKNAEFNANLSMTRGKESDSKNAVSLALELLAKINKAQKKYAEALKFQSAYIAANDSLKTDETLKSVIATDLNRVHSDNTTLQRANKKIASKNTDYIKIIILFTILLILLVALLALYYKRNLEKKATNLLLQQQKKEIAEVNEELTTQMDIVSAQNVELEKLNQVKNKFFSIVSHDLRSPMNSLKMLFELFREGDLEKSELNKLTLKIEDTINTTATFLDNLLEWSKNQLDGLVVRASSVSIYQIVADNIKLIDSQIKLKAIAVKNNIKKDSLVFADPDMLTVVVRNLLSNAIKFCHTGDQVTFNAELINKELVWSIADNGPGISEKDQESLFNLSHTNSTGTSGEKGYHLGLILCKDMIVQNQGTIKVESTLGAGTTFYITLPATDPTATD